MNFTFIIPTNNSQLLNSSGDSYYVSRVYNAKDIPDKLKECKTSITSDNNIFYVIDHFDTYFSIIENYKTLLPLNILRSFDLLSLTVDKLSDQLTKVLHNQNELNSTNRISYLNATKMIVYLITNTVKCVDLIIDDHQKNQMRHTKKLKVINVDAFEGQDWEKKRLKFLVRLFNLIQLPLEKLWDPPVTEETFVNLICDSCYRGLEIYATKEKHIRDTIFQILGVTIKRYNHAFSFPVRILQILRLAEDTVVPIANGILLLHEEFNLSSIFSIIIKDIVDSLDADYNDIKITRNFSTFLTEFGVIAPKLVIPHLSALGDELLNCESHVLRNCVLQLMGEVLISELSTEDLSDEMKEIRNEFLDSLLEHINDVSAHVRSKVLQIWHHLKEEKYVPLKYDSLVLIASVERLDDKTATVRKNAVILIKSFLEGNPYSSELTLIELNKKHALALEQLDNLKNQLAEENVKLDESEKEFETLIPTLMPIIEEVLHDNIEENPFNSQEEFEDMVKRMSVLFFEKKYREAIVLAKRADSYVGNLDWRTLQFEEQCAYYLSLLKSYVLINNISGNSIKEQFDLQTLHVNFLESAIEFSKIITQAIPKIQNMLLSKTNSDVFEAVDFFTAGYLFKIKGTECGMTKMLCLVWSNDKEKRDAVLNAYKRILFTTDQSGRSHGIKVVKNISALFEEFSYGHYIALECLIKEWVESDDIDLTIIQILFEMFTMKLEGVTENESRQALQILILCSTAKHSIVTANIKIIEQIGFGDRALKDPRIYSSCLEFLLNSVPQESRTKYYKRYDRENLMVQKTITLFTKFFFHPKIENFDEITIKALEFFYYLCQAPDIIVQTLISDLHLKLKTFIGKINGIPILEKVIPQSQELTQGTSKDSLTGQQLNLPVFLVTRFIFIIGYATIKEMIYLDVDIYNNLKYRDDLKEQNKKKKNKKDVPIASNSSANKRKTLVLDMSASETIKRLSGTAAEPQQEPDEQLVGATAEDNIAEIITYICENEMLFKSNGVLNKIIPIIIEICKFPGKYNDNGLQQAASLTLIRFMIVSSKFCEDNMSFLMNILSKTKNNKIKCNILIGLSDLTFRFPNIIDPYTRHIYLTLHDTDDEVRLTAVKMLSHLILHEMIRVKGQISDLALCIVDQNEEIQNMTKQFFREISNKSNILYNVLPDIISKLSDVNLDLNEIKYRTIMKYILGLIEKDRQVETLVEKLCLRFDVTKEERQWRDIAYCLSLLSYTERTINKLIDNIHLFKDKVQIDEVHESFKLIISATLKTKPKFKQLVVEFENRLNECLEVKDDNNENNIDKKNTKAAGSSKNDKNKRQPGRRGRGRKDQTSSEESESQEVVPKKVANKKKVPKSQTSSESEAERISKKSANKKKVATSQTSSEESDSSENDTPTKSTKDRNNKNKTPQQRRFIETSSSEEEAFQTNRKRNKK